MTSSRVRRTALRAGVAVCAPALALLPALPASAASGTVEQEVRLDCDPATWRVEYTAGSGGHAPRSTVTTRIDIGTVDEYGPDKVTQAPPYGLGSAATTGDVNRETDATGAWSTHEVLDPGGGVPSGHPRALSRTFSVVLRVDGGTGPVTTEARCTLQVG
ncbi:hypothetical protein ACH4F6_14635 [Streptomyces sp. NPDC017936]|uniref:hypothetical protein n=1 Tax=Streptomyces sp. NPDC017936 TaxID=3365016 RepID=UPI00379ED945